MPKKPIARLRHTLARLFSTPEARRHALVGPAHLWQMKRAFQIDYLRRMGLAPEHHLLDLGCGTLRGGIPLIEYLGKGHYTGLEVRAEVLAEARRELAAAGLEGQEPHLVHVTDLAAIELSARFEYAWAFSVLIHMDDATLAKAVALVARHLAPEGRFLANVRLGAAREERWEEFPVVTRTLEFYQAQGARHGLLVEDVGPLSELGHRSGDPEQDGQRMLHWRRAR